MSERPTDEELERIQAAGEQQEMDRDQYANNAEIDNAGRRALYEAGQKDMAERLLSDELARWSALFTTDEELRIVKSYFKSIYDHITG